MWESLFKWIGSLFKSPSRVAVIDMAERAFELSNKAMDEVRDVREMLEKTMEKEVECRRSLHRERLERMEECEGLRKEIRELKSKQGG